MAAVVLFWDNNMAAAVVLFWDNKMVAIILFWDKTDGRSCIVLGQEHRRRYSEAP